MIPSRDVALPGTARRFGIRDRDTVVVESPRGKVTGTALFWPAIRPDTIFVPNAFGPAYKCFACRISKA